MYSHRRCTPIITAKLRVQTIHQCSVRKIEDHNKISGFADQINKQVVISRTYFYHVQASWPCCMFKLYIPAACPCWMFMLHIHTACPHCIFLLHIDGACQCCTYMLLLHAVQSVFTWYPEDLNKKIKTAIDRPFCYFSFSQYGHRNLQALCRALQWPPECPGRVHRHAIFCTPSCSFLEPSWVKVRLTSLLFAATDSPTVRTLPKMVKKPWRSWSWPPHLFSIALSSSPHKAVSRLHICSACPCCMSVQHVHAAFSWHIFFCMTVTMLQVMSILHVFEMKTKSWMLNKVKRDQKKFFAYF